MMDNKSKEKQQQQQLQKQQQQQQSNNGGTTPSNKTKEKRRSNEKRKEKSRDAARCRRSRETEIFTELAHVLPLRREDVDQLDKASVMRLSIAFLKVREMLKLFPKVKDIKTEKTSDVNKVGKEKKLFDILNGPESNKLLSTALDGFLIILSSEGDVTYVSENISEYLGIAQIDILGQQIWEYSHQCDHDELKEALNMRRTSVDSIDIIKKEDNNQTKTTKDNDNNKINDILKTVHRDFYIRLKCTLTTRGRNVNIKSASYKVIHMTGHIIMNGNGERILVAIGRPLPHPSNIEIPLGSTTFLTKHSLDMKFTYADDNMLSLLGYRPEDLLGKSLYDYHYSADSESLMATFKSVLSKGQGETNRYRFLGKCGGYSWVVTQATIVYDKQKPQSVVCVNYAISNLENNNEIYSCEQLEAFNKKKESTTILVSDQQLLLENFEQQKQQSQQQKIIATAQTANNKLLPTRQGSPAAAAVSIVDNPNEKLLLSTSTNSPTLVKVCYQQQQQQQILLQEQAQNNNNNSFNSPISKCEEKQNRIYCENSLSPIRHTFNKCSINTNNNNNNINNCVLQQQQQQQQYKQPKPINSSAQRVVGPKIVTASVFKKVTVPPTKLGFSSSSSSSSISTTPAPVPAPAPAPVPASSVVNNTPKPQSVTTSVLIPISSLSKTTQQNINRSVFISGGGTGAGAGAGVGVGGTISSGGGGATNSSESKIQQQRPQDMNKGFSMFLDDPTELTMLKEEPDDLTHLAPTAGDACIPLDDSTPLFGEMLEGLMLPDSYGTLLSDDINSLDSQQSNNNNSNISNNNNNNNNKTHIDPFINYRDESSDTTGSPHLLSPGASKSPEVSSIPSLCSPNSLSQEDEFAFMTMNDEIDLTMRAPYIPMNEQEDLPLLTEDLMWSAFTEELHKDIKEALQIEIKNNCNSSNSNSNSINNNNNTNTSNLNNHNSGNCNGSLNGCSSSLRSSISNNSCSSSSSSSSSGRNGSCISSSSSNNNNNNSNNNDPNSESSLAALLCTSTNNSIHHQGSGGGGGGGGVVNSNVGVTTTQTTTASILGQANNHNELSKKRKFELTDNTTSSSSSSSSSSLSPPSGSGGGGGGALVDSIDAFGQVFNNKNSPNIDCWTINDLLQISPISLSTSSSSPTTANNLTQSNIKQQNLIVNTAAATTTFHVPLITLQHNGNKISLTRSNSIGSINNNNNTTSRITKGVGGIGVVDVVDQQCHKKLNMTKILTATSIPTTATKSSSTNMNNIVTTNCGETTNNATCNKRHLNVTTTSLDSKRCKNSSSVEIQTSPQLLQQLMAPTPQRQRSKSMMILEKSQNSRWSLNGGGAGGGGGGNGNQQQNGSNNNSSMSSSPSSPSNSVLKNLLVSGCDGTTFSPQPPDVLMMDDCSRDSVQEHFYNNNQQLSPGVGGLNNYSKPLQCETALQYSRYCGSNPMIGGPGILPSPPIPIPTGAVLENMTFNNNNNNNSSNNDKINNQQNNGNHGNNSSCDNYVTFSPKLVTLNDSDSGSDSGVECGGSRGGGRGDGRSIQSMNLATKLLTTTATSKMTSLNPMRRIDLPPNLDLYGDEDSCMSMSGDEAPPPLEPTDFSALSSPQSTATTIPTTTTLSSSYSPFMIETSNSTLDCGGNSPPSFLMDFCSDDYAMSELLQDTEINKVLDEWNSEMT